ncbi:hypothetical protein K4K61_012857 [Colletotrichum sp. SAR11_59]|nr:hypothetical protein K4K61_012857 [Colletotrichum sp. SAR11_59]
MALKLWGSPTFGCTHRVMITLNELGIDYDLSQITLQKGEQKDPDYIKMYHPFGRIPVIQGGDLQLFESRAICRYIVAKFGASSSLDVITSGDPIMIGKFEKALSIDYSYFDPSSFSLADIYVFTWMPYIMFLGLYDEVAARPKFEGLWKTVSTRQSWQKVLKDMPQ